MSEQYFSDRELGPRPQTEEEITERAWGGLFVILSQLIDTGAFGIDFPEECPDGYGVIGTDQGNFRLALSAEVHDLPWPLNAGDVPPALALMDLIEFCHRHIAKPNRIYYHSFYSHYHLDYNREEGQSEFRDNINRVFARNGLAYELQEDGSVRRLAPPVLREELAVSQFNTGDNELDNMLESARSKYLNPDPQIREESLEKLWDAWERIKTIEPGVDKKASVESLLSKAASEPTFREALRNEALELTRIGNTFRIRHSETSQIPLDRREYVDYLFHRLFSLINLVLKSR